MRARSLTPSRCGSRTPRSTARHDVGAAGSAGPHASPDPGSTCRAPLAAGGLLLAQRHPPPRVRAHLAAPRWRRWGRAIVLHNGPLNRQQQWFVGRIHGGPHALLTGLTAAEACGLRGWERDEVHIVMPVG